MNNIVQFNNHKIELIKHQGQSYMTLSQIASVLEYSDRNKVSNLYNAHKDEFEGKSLVLDLGTRGNPAERARVFNREGLVDRNEKKPAYAGLFW